MKVTLIGEMRLVNTEGGPFGEFLGRGREDQFQGTDPMKLIEAAGRICYDSPGRGRSSAEYAAHILKVGHGSVTEHATFSFLLTGISRNLTHELVRHRVGVAISQRSSRYCDESESDHIPHPFWLSAVREAESGRAEDPEDAAELLALQAEKAEAQEQARSLYRREAALLERIQTRRGVNKLAARKQARGAARANLPTNLETAMIWTANVRMLRTVLDQRASPFADAEIRELGMHLYRIMRDRLPAYFEDYTVSEAPDGLGECATRG